MTTYSQITDSEIDPGSPGTENLFTKIRDNPISMLEGDPTAPQPAPIVSMVFLERQVVTSPTPTLDFFSFDNSIYDGYKFVLGNIRSTTSNNSFRAVVSTNGSTFDTGSNYRTAATNTTTSSDATFLNIASPVSSLLAINSLDGDICVYGAGFTTSTKLPYNISYRNTTPAFSVIAGAGEHHSGAAVLGIRFYWLTDGFSAGTITMYGLRNSYGGSFP